MLCRLGQLQKFHVGLSIYDREKQYDNKLETDKNHKVRLLTLAKSVEKEMINLVFFCCKGTTLHSFKLFFVYMLLDANTTHII